MNNPAKKFTIFRRADSSSLEEADIMTMAPTAEKLVAPITACIEAGYLDGAETRVIFAGFGLSLVHVWFKCAFPLPLHAHDADCVYYIIGGNLRLGTETLGAGDGFFVPADVPYTYTPGPDGVELIEVRNSDRFDYRETSTPQFWKKALATVESNRAAWATASRISGVAG